MKKEPTFTLAAIAILAGLALAFINPTRAQPAAPSPTAATPVR